MPWVFLHNFCVCQTLLSRIEFGVEGIFYSLCSLFLVTANTTNTETYNFFFSFVASEIAFLILILLLICRIGRLILFLMMFAMIP